MLSSAKPNAVGSHVDITTIDINAIDDSLMISNRATMLKDD